MIAGYALQVLAIKEKDRKPVLIGALGVFAVTYVPLMVKFFRVFSEKDQNDRDLHPTNRIEEK